jgi:hypothetical protein
MDNWATYIQALLLLCMCFEDIGSYVQLHVLEVLSTQRESSKRIRTKLSCSWCGLKLESSKPAYTKRGYSGALVKPHNNKVLAREAMRIT